MRRKARILVIDDQDWPAREMFERDGYHIERWPDVANLHQLTDGDYDLILLDINGVGLRESPDKQGLGILEHVKDTNPAQTVIVYSAATQRVAETATLARADAVMDKGDSYVNFKAKVDILLTRRATPEYFVAAMNATLAGQAALVPKAVPLAIKALRTGRTDGFASYLQRKLNDPQAVDLVVSIVRIGIRALAELTSA